jgi:NADH dehydrogenase/NADH:ubiquinone oxidoreductase subunit G
MLSGRKGEASAFGMKIITQSPEIFKSRRLQLQFILLNHPMTCPRCEKEGECNLQRLVYEYGVEETLYPWERISSPADDRSPLLQRDSDKCILCGRCVRICDEVQGVGELSFSRRICILSSIEIMVGFQSSTKHQGFNALTLAPAKDDTI